MKPYFSDDHVTIYHGDCRDVLPHLEPVETCVTDPPYGLEFMGVAWDTMRPDGKERARNEWADFGSREHARHPSERARIQRNKGLAYYEFMVEHLTAIRAALLPGSMLLSFGGTRTFHRLTCAIEDAGFEIRDCLMWLYGSGFPKSLDISKALDKGVEREVVGNTSEQSGRTPGLGTSDGFHGGIVSGHCRDITAPATDAAKLWHGWGTALKPAYEPIVCAMNPLDGTFAENALKHGVAGLNIDGCRIGTEDDCARAPNVGGRKSGIMGQPAEHPGGDGSPLGRWPANVILDEDAAELLDEMSGERGSFLPSGRVYPGGQKTKHAYGEYLASATFSHGDSGGASRFFYTAKASRSDRGEDNTHPTVKPTDLMEWLCKLTMTPTGGTVLDPFMGSGSTLVAARNVGRKAIGIDDDEESCEIAVKRLAQGMLDLGAA